MSNPYDPEQVSEGDLDTQELAEYYQKLQTDNELLYFNGINGATGAYGVEPQSAASLAAVIQGTPQPANLGELNLKRGAPFPIKPPNDGTRLDHAGWAAVFHKDADPNIKEALGELLALRQEQAGERFKVYDGPDGYQPGETKADFCERHGVGGGPADPEQMPYYVLVVGGPDEIPYEFQYQLDVMRGVGRIHFDDIQDYARYARNVRLAESRQVRLPRRASFFGVKNPDDRATELSAKHLVRPLHTKLQQRQPLVRWVEEGNVRKKTALDWQFETFLAEQATKAQLGNLLGGEQTPALLFSASHGMEFPLNDSRQVSHQGALLCQDWPGPNAWRGGIPQDFYLAGDDLSADANVLGLMAFFFACYGAGTPQLDQFSKQAFKDQRATIAPHDFVGHLPQRLLRQGALAVVGHVERAWGYSFISPGAGEQTGTFEGTLLQLLSGDPVGWTTENLNMRYAELSSDLSLDLERLEHKPDYMNPYDLAQKWTANNDARSYVVIGDPAARLPIALPQEKPTRRPSLGEVVAPQASAKIKATASAAAIESSPGPQDLAATEFGLRDQWSKLTDSIRQFANELADALAEAAGDITSLEVRTYTTNDLQGLPPKSAGGAQLRALTRIAFDGDTDIFVPQNAEGVDAAIWKLHLDMVRQARLNRAESLQTLTEMAANLLKSFT
jgi:hypothetical protein